MQKQIEKAIPISAKVFDRVSEVVTSDKIDLFDNQQGEGNWKGAKTHSASCTFASLNPPMTRDTI